MKFSLPITILAVFCSSLSFGQVTGTPVYSWDFADGIPADWQNEIISPNNLAEWEYRGPNTNPDVTVGGRGSCAAIAQPIASQTAANGFVIFDSNYWDDNDNLCGGFGTGQDPAPHTAWLATGPMNLSTEIGAILTFQQQYRHFQSTTKVQISINGGSTWSDILTNPTNQSDPAVWSTVNISAYTVGQTDVRLRFIFTGTYYWWILDDITVFEPNANDIAITRVRYTNNQGIGSAFPYNDLEYDQYPSIMIPPFNFKTTAQNIGAYQQTGVKLNTTIIRDGVTQTYSQNSSQTSMNSGANNTFSITTPYTNPATLGEYEIIYTISQNQTDDNLQNNKDTLDYTIHPYCYARDEGPMENEFVANPYYVNLGYTFEAGNYFQARNSGKKFHSIGVALGEGTMPGTQIRGIVYKDGLEEIWGQTDLYTVNIANLNDTGEERIVNIPLLNDITLQNDSIYLVMISQTNVNEPVTICRSGDAPEEMSIVRYPEVNAMFYFLKTPVVRMNIFNPDQIPGCTDINASNYMSTATINDGTCLYPGCSNETADNYDPNVNFDDGSCALGGCNDPLADNYNPLATYNNNTCQYFGCTDQGATNYDPIAVTDDGSCLFLYALFNVSANSGCAPFTVEINNQTDIQANGICSFTVNDELISNECVSSFDYTFENPGNYIIEYTYDLNGTVTTASQTINVLNTPTVNPLTYDSNTNTVSCPGCAANTYQWFVDGASIGGNTSTVNTFSDGTYQNGFYQVELTNNNGCTNESNNVFVLQPYFSATPITGCAPLEVTLTNLTDPVNGMITTVNWGDGTEVTAPIDEITHVYTSGGPFDIQMEVSNQNGNGTYTLEVNPTANTTPILIQNGDFIECTNCDEFVSVGWEINGNTYTGNGPFPVEVGTFVVTGTNDAGCSGSAEIVIISVTEIDANAFRFYPNPADDRLYFESVQGQTYQLRILDSLGQLVFSTSASQTGRIELNTKNWASGIYQLEVIGNAQTQAGRFVVQH